MKLGIVVAGVGVMVSGILAAAVGFGVANYLSETHRLCGQGLNQVMVQTCRDVNNAYSTLAMSVILGLMSALIGVGLMVWGAVHKCQHSSLRPLSPLSSSSPPPTSSSIPATAPLPQCAQCNGWLTPKNGGLWCEKCVMWRMQPKVERY